MHFEPLKASVYNNFIITILKNEKQKQMKTT